MERFTTRFWPAFAALFVFHLAASAILYAVACSGFLAGYHNGHGLWNFALDSFSYHDLAMTLQEKLTAGDYAGWQSFPKRRHAWFISVFYYLFGPYPISYAPANSATWALSVIIVNRISNVIFPGIGKASVACALVFGIWPSFFLTGTQLLRDPFYNLGTLAFILGWVALLAGNQGYRYGALAGAGVLLTASIRLQFIPFMLLAAAVATLIILLRNRSSFIYALSAWVVMGAGFFAYTEAPKAFAYTVLMDDFSQKWPYDHKRIKEVEEAARNISGIRNDPEFDALLDRWFTIDTIYSPWLGFDVKERILLTLAEEHKEGLKPFLAHLGEDWNPSSWIPVKVQINYIMHGVKMRDDFLTFYLAPGGSNMDTSVLFRSAEEIIAYTPRAVEIAALAPFPNQWFVPAAQGGRMARALSGVEMVTLYVLWAGFAIFLIFSETSRMVKFWLAFFVFITILPLGLFVPNIGTLYRLRFVYLAPVLICGVEGLRLAFERFRPKKPLSSVI